MKNIYFLLLLIASNSAIAQLTLTDTIESKILNEKRTIRIHIPKSYGQTDKLPLILTLDGEYMFYNLIGNSELLLATEEIPETLIVGIDQNYQDYSKNYVRWEDCSYNSKSGKLQGKGIKFKKFINKELIPYLINKYKIGGYKVLVGHSFTASYVNFFLFDNSIFNSFILLSPYISVTHYQKINDKLSNNNKFLSYYISTAEHDLKGHLKTVSKLDSILSKKTINPKTQYTFNNFKGETHYSLINRSFPLALKSTFKDYQLITEKEIKFEKDLLLYLKNKYAKIKEQYDITLSIKKDDLETIYWLAEEREDWKVLKDIGKYSINIYPEYPDGYFMLSTVAEQNKNYKKALKLYKKGYLKLGDDVLNKKDFYKHIERLEKINNNNTLTDIINN
ncbi:alpha/beta hydrolase [Tenacibaculum soleae]|uniref:alpha/beta hydrolase n=1 Tax=Tenacibaculum soleae TaxID=447689 RepID=UPI0023006025|nr:alpha/beta hydrolase-fold protein [Tenacibaculum soleae]